MQSCCQTIIRKEDNVKLLHTSYLYYILSKPFAKRELRLVYQYIHIHPYNFTERILYPIHTRHHLSSASSSFPGSCKHFPHLIATSLFCELKLESLKIAECSSLFRRCAVPFPRGRIPFRNSVTLLHIFLHGARVGIAREIWGGEGCECNVSYRCALTRDAQACGTIGPWESVRASRVRCELSISANIVAPIEIKPSARYEMRRA